MIYSLLIIAILFFLGFGITYLLLPTEVKKYSFWLIPWFGIITAILFLVISSFLGVPVKISAIVLLIFSLITNAFVISKRKNLITFGDLKENLLTSILIAGSVFFLIYPLIKISNYPTTISFGNNDISAYVEGADYLIDNSIQKSFYTQTNAGVKDILLGAFRFGPTILYSFFSTVLNLNPYEVSYILQVAIFPLVAPLIYLLIEILYKKSFIGLFLSFFISVFNINLLYMSYHNFFPHTIFRGLLCFTLIFILLYFSHLKKKVNEPFLNNYDLIISLGLGAAFLSYQEAMVVFLIVPLAVYVFILALIKKNTVYIDKLLKIGFITLVVAFQSVIYSFRFLFYLVSFSNSKAVIGWQLFRSKIPYANPFEALGFYSIHEFPPLPNLLAILLSTLVLFIIIYGIFKTKKKLLSTTLLIFYLLILMKSWLVTPNFFDYGRTLSYTLPIFIILFSVGFSDLFKDNKKIGIIFLATLIGLELFSAYKLNKRFIRESFSVDKTYLTLKEIQSEKKIINEPLYLENDIDPNIPYWNYVWTRYFLNLNKFPITSEVSKIKGKRVVVSENNLVLIHKSNAYPHSLKILLNDIIWENDFFKIGRLCKSDKCLISTKEDLSKIIFGKTSFEDSLLISGWSAGEPESRWAEGKQSSLKLINNKEKTKIIIEALTLKEPQTVEVSIDDVLVGSFSPSLEFKMYSVALSSPLSQGLHTLVFTYSNTYKPSEIFGSADNRELSVNFKQIRLK